MLKTARSLSVFISVVAAISTPLAAFSEPLKGGVSETGAIQSPPSDYGNYGYPAPQMVQPQQPLQGQVREQRPPQRKVLNGNAQQQAPLQQRQPIQMSVQQRPPLQMNVQQSVELPPQFMGAWLVRGQRTKVESLPQYQSAMDGIFAMQTQNIWRITGNPQMGYQLGSDTGATMPLQVVECNGATATIRYQHPMKNTMIQEAVVMQLVNGGMQFNGFERLSVVKPGEGPPRAKVTYQLQGQRQR